MGTNLWLAAFGVPLGGFQYGFHLGIINLIQTIILKWYEMVRDLEEYPPLDNPEFMNPVLMACIPIGAILGSILSGFLADKIGRKLTILASTGFLILGTTLMVAAPPAFCVEILFVGRFIVGIYIGINSVVVPMYLIEISQDLYRGLGGSMYGIMVAFGFFFAIVMGLPDVLGTAYEWNMAIAMCFIAAFFQIVILAVCAESPKYLFINKNDEDEGECALMWLRECECEHLDEELDALREEINALKEVGPFRYDSLCNEQTIRSPFIICTVIVLGHHFCGINVLFCYSYEVLRDVQFNVTASKHLVLWMGLVYLAVSLLAAYLVECIGRKPLILISFAGMTFVTFCLTVVSILAQTERIIFDNIRYALSIFQYLFIIAFAFGAGTIPWFITQEMHNHDARASASATVNTIGWFGSFIVFMSFVPLVEAIGSYIYVCYFVANLITVIFLAVTMRETMDENAVDIIEMFYD